MPILPGVVLSTLILFMLCMLSTETEPHSDLTGIPVRCCELRGTFQPRNARRCTSTIMQPILLMPGSKNEEIPAWGKAVFRRRHTSVTSWVMRKLFMLGFSISRTYDQRKTHVPAFYWSVTVMGAVFNLQSRPPLQLKRVKQPVRGGKHHRISF